MGGKKTHARKVNSRGVTYRHRHRHRRTNKHPPTGAKDRPTRTMDVPAMIKAVEEGTITGTPMKELGLKGRGVAYVTDALIVAWSNERRGTSPRTPRLSSRSSTSSRRRSRP